MQNLLWNPIEHTDDENLKWCWLRSVEWGRWPIFLSRPIAPVLLLILPWYVVIVGFFVLDIFWALIFRYQFVSVNAAFLGSMFGLLRWITWPAVTIFLFLAGANSRILDCCILACADLYNWGNPDDRNWANSG